VRSLKVDPPDGSTAGRLTFRESTSERVVVKVFTHARSGTACRRRASLKDLVFGVPSFGQRVDAGELRRGKVRGDRPPPDLIA
jgi:hypothetical protein